MSTFGVALASNGVEVSATGTCTCGTGPEGKEKVGIRAERKP